MSIVRAGSPFCTMATLTLWAHLHIFLGWFSHTLKSALAACKWARQSNNKIRRTPGTARQCAEGHPASIYSCGWRGFGQRGGVMETVGVALYCSSAIMTSFWTRTIRMPWRRIDNEKVQVKHLRVELLFFCPLNRFSRAQTASTFFYSFDYLKNVVEMINLLFF